MLELQGLQCYICGGEPTGLGYKRICPVCGATYESAERLDGEALSFLNAAIVDRNRLYFDEALKRCELVLENNPSLEEGNWQALLSYFGVRYERKGISFEPVCYRVREISVTECPYYESISDEHKAKAEEIERVRKVLASETDEEIYDVFICCKYAEEYYGEELRTKEAAWAEDAYEMLRGEYGLKVFYAEKYADEGKNKLAVAHSALKSAKWLLVVTAGVEHLQDPLIKGEWKRFTADKNAGMDKHIRVLYGGFDPRGLPVELRDSNAIDREGFGWNLLLKKAAEGIFLTPKSEEEERLETERLERERDKAEIVNLQNALIEACTQKERFEKELISLRASDKERAEEFAAAKANAQALETTEKQLQTLREETLAQAAALQRAKERENELLAALELEKANASGVLLAKELAEKDLETLRSEIARERAEILAGEESAETFKIKAEELNEQLEQERLLRANEQAEYLRERAAKEDETAQLRAEIELLKVQLSDAEGKARELENALVEQVETLRIAQLAHEAEVNAEREKAEQERKERAARLAQERIEREKQAEAEAARAKAEAERLALAAEELRKAEEMRLAAEREQAELRRLEEERLEKERIEEEKRQAELRRIEEERLAEERRIEEERLAEERQLQALARKAEEDRANSVIRFGLLKKYNGEGGDVVIPEEVTRIDSNAFLIPDKLTGITLPPEMTRIQEKTFAGCGSLKKVAFPKELEEIGASAFSGCKQLESIDLPESVTEIASSAFSGCKSLKEVRIPSEVVELADNVFARCDGLEQVCLPRGLEVIGAKAFLACKSLTAIEIPENVSEIQSDAFFDCEKLERVELPKRARILGENAFWGCTALKSVRLNAGLKRIGEAAFNRCEGLTEIVIPASVTTIGQRAFWFCKNLTIYAEAEEKPDGWDESWNPDNCPVIWGYRK